MTHHAPRRELVGLVPAAGRASRLGEITSSKEILPLPGEDGGPSRPACHDLLATFARAGVARAFVLLREGKWDIPGRLGDGAEHGLHLAYRVLSPTPGVPFTLAAGFPFVQGADVALGFPDILLHPHDLLLRLRAHHDAGEADCSLALVPCDRPWASDLVATDATGRVTRLAIKPRDARSGVTWALAIWSPRFTDFFADFVDSHRQRPEMDDGREIHVGDVFNAAIDRGLHVGFVECDDGRMLDLGTPESLRRASEGGWTRNLDPQSPRR